MNYTDTFCFWTLSTEFKTFGYWPWFFSQSFYIEKFWKSYHWWHLIWICSCSVGHSFSTMSESSWRAPDGPSFTSSVTVLPLSFLPSRGCRRAPLCPLAPDFVLSVPHHAEVIQGNDYDNTGASLQRCVDIYTELIISKLSIWLHCKTCLV